MEVLSPFTRAELERLAARAQSRFFAFGDTVCNAGDPAEGLFVIKSGSIRVFTEEHGKEISMGVRKDRRRVRRDRDAARVPARIVGARIGEERAAVHTAQGHRCRSLPAIRRRAPSSPATSRSVRPADLSARLFDLRGKVNKTELEEFIRSVGVKQVERRQGDPEAGLARGPRLYVVRHGEVRIVRHEEGTEYPLATLRQGEIFGEKACLMRQEQSASVTASTDTALLVIPEKTVHFILERNPKLREVLEERVRFVERELQRQKKLAERRKLAGRCSICSPSPSSARRSSSALPWSSRPRRWIAARPAWR